MVARVVDASALCALAFGEPEAEAVKDQLSGYRLLAPHLLPFEVASTCVTKVRRHPEDRERILRGFELFQRMAVDLVAVDPLPVISLAERQRLTAHDASHLWLARRLGAGLVTLDRRLAAAASSG